MSYGFSSTRRGRRGSGVSSSTYASWSSSAEASSPATGSAGTCAAGAFLPFALAGRALSSAPASAGSATATARPARTDSVLFMTFTSSWPRLPRQGPAPSIRPYEGPDGKPCDAGHPGGTMPSVKPVYLDHHATTPVDPAVLAAMLPYFSEKFGNASSRQHLYGQEADLAVQVARAEVAELISAPPGDIIFTSGA